MKNLVFYITGSFVWTVQAFEHAKLDSLHDTWIVFTCVA